MSIWSKDSFAQSKSINNTDSLRNALREKRNADSLARETIKQKNRSYLDSLKTARVQKRIADSLSKLATKALLLQERKTRDSLTAILRQRTKDSLKLDRERIALERKQQAEQLAILRKPKLTPLQLEKLKQDSIEKAELEAEKLAMLAEKRERDSLLAIEKEIERLAKIQRQKTKDSLTEIAKQEAQAKKKTKDSLLLIEKEQEMLATIQRQKTKDSLQSISKEIKRKEIEAEKKMKDSLKTLKEELAAIERLEAQKRKRQEDSLANVTLLEQKLKEETLQKTKDSIQNKKNEDDRLRAIQLQKTADSLLLAKQKMINDSLQMEETRIRKMNLRIRKQQIEDSLYLVEAKMKAVEMDSMVNAILKKEAELLRQAQLDSIKKSLVNEIIPESQKPDTIFIQPEISIPKLETPLTPNKKLTLLSFRLGQSNYLGDLGGNSGIGKAFAYDINTKQRTFFYGFGVTRFPHRAIGIQFNYSYGKIAGSDQDVSFKDKNDPAYFRFKRNLNFRSTVSELSLLTEFYPFQIHANKESTIKWIQNLSNCSFQPYILAGFGRFKFNPQGSYYDEIAEDFIWVDLQPLRLEGQGMKEYPSRSDYNLSQINIPFGIGLRYALGAKSYLSFEFIGRKLFTDYLDDVSTTYINPNYFSSYLDEENASIASYMHDKSNLIDPDNRYKTDDIRGNSTSNDFYYSFNLKLSIQLSKNAILKKSKKASELNLNQ